MGGGTAASRLRPALAVLLAVASLWGGLVQAAGPRAPVPAILGWSPGVTRDVPPSGPLTLYFTRAMDRLSVQRGWSLSPSVAGTFHWAGTAVTWTPRGALLPGRSYRLTLGAAARDMAGTPLGAPFRLTFSTGDALAVRSFTPASGTKGVPVNGVIAVTFNHPMIPLRGLDAAPTGPPGWRVSISPATRGFGSWLGTSTWVFHPTGGLIPSSRYTVTLAGTARDAWGERLGRTLRWSFHTVTPEVVAESPRNGSSFADPRGTVKVTFNQPMDPGATAPAFSLRTGGRPVPGTITWNGYTLVFHPRLPMASQRAYVASVETSARSAMGKGSLRKRVAWRFHAAPPPRILSVDANRAIPANGPQVQIYFSAPMSQQSLDRHLRISPQLSHMNTNIWGPNESREFTYTIFGDFQPSTRYTVGLAPGIRDRFGRPLPGSLRYRFTTNPMTPQVALYGMPGAQEGISFSAGRAMNAPIQLINVSRVTYTLIRTSLKALTRMRQTSPTSPPAGRTVRSWTEDVPHPLNKVQNRDVRLVLSNGSPLSPGLYWLGAEASGDVPAASSELVVVTNVGVTMKRGLNGALVWVTSPRTGDGAAGVPVAIVTDQGKTLATTRTDTRGVARFHRNFFQYGNVSAMVGAGGLFGMARLFWQPQISPLSLGIAPWQRTGPPPTGTYLYTDRPVYRPGQQVHFRAVLWQDRDGVYSLLAGKTVVATVNDNLGHSVYRAKLALDRFGAVHGSFALRRNAATGYDWLSVSVPNTGIGVNSTFQVAEYRKPEFLTTVIAGRKGYVQGETLTATVHVQYLFGAPVTRQQVAWTAYAQPLFPEPPGWEGYTFFDWQAYWRQIIQPQPPQSQFGGTLAQGSGVTDGRGRLTIHLPVDLRKSPIGQTITVEATTQDASHMPMSGRVQVPAYKARFFIGLSPDHQVVPTGQQEKIAVVAVTPEGQTLPHQPVVARIYRRTYTTKLNANSGGWSSWQSVPHDTLLETQDLTTDAQGHAAVAFTPRDGGEYYVAVTGKNGLGNAARSATSIWASAEGFSQWGIADSTEITLKPDRTTYRVGDTAHILVGSPFDHATALVTLERSGIRDVRVAHLASASSLIDVPITLDDLPNVYVTVTLYHGWRGNSPPDWRYGVTNLAVQVDPRHLVVRLAGDSARHRPGDHVRYTMTTTDARGRPVSAEVSLALVDTAVLALQSEANPDILQALYSQRPLGVSTTSDGVLSIDHLKDRPNFPVQPVFAGGVAGGGGGGGCGVSCLSYAPVQAAAAPVPKPRAPATGGGGVPPGITVRSRFLDTAYWSADVRTDRSGRASVWLRLPDNATTWRLDVRGVTGTQSVGQAELRTLATQDIVVRPVAPRFLVEGDRLRIGAIVNNNLRHRVTARVSIAAAGLALRSSWAVTITIPGNGERLASWDVGVPLGARAALTFWAAPVNSGVRGDAVRIALPVHPPMTDETVATAGQVFGSVRQYVVVPSGAMRQPGELTIQVSASLTAGMDTAFADLQPSKWESNEDVADRVLAAAALRSLPASLGDLSPVARSRLPAIIAAGIVKLRRHQLGDGGWPWFNGPLAQSDPAITGDVVQALAAAGSRGTPMQRGRSYLRSALNDPNLLDEQRAHAMLGLALSGRAPRRPAERLFNNSVRRSHLSTAALADLGWALARSGDGASARTVISTLDSRAMVSATGAHWESSSWDFSAAPAIATTTRVLAALVALDPHDAFVPAAARWLMLARQGPSWDCPPDSAQAIATLSSYARAAQEGRAEYRYRVLVGQAAQLAGRYDGSNQRQSRTVQVAVDRLGPGRRNSVLVDRQQQGGGFGPGPLYYVARLHYFLHAAGISPRDEGITVRRRYLNAKGGEIGSTPAGSVLQVHLTLHTDGTLLYLHVDDPLPAGLEPIDQSLQTSQQGLFKPRWWFFGRQPDLSWFLDHVDLRDDRVSLYARYLPPGTYTYTYLAVATVPGRYGVAPTHAAESFFPEVFGRSAGQTFTVR